MCIRDSVSTPYMDEAAICDRVALMQGGQVMTISTPPDVIRNFPLSLLSVKSGDIYQLLSELRGYPGVHSVYTFGQSAHVAFHKTDIQKEALAEFLKKKNHQSIQVEPIEATIEDCFMELMSKSEKEIN